MAFKMRTTKPEAGNKYYITKAKGGYSNAIKGKPVDKDCDVLSNCVGYAYGRFNEIGAYGYCKYLSPVNAENFIQYKNTGLTVGQTPKLGACMVWQKGNTLSGSDGAGHVAIVEKVISNTEVYTSESGWNSKPFWNQTRKKGTGNWGQDASYKFLGFIYNPAVKETGSVSPSKPSNSPSSSNSSNNSTTSVLQGKINTIKEVQYWANQNYKAGLDVDGSCGALTRKALIKILQTELNKVYNAGLDVDGSFGSLTKAACPNLRQGMNNGVVGVLQALLICNGYNEAYIDKSYGSITTSAVKSFQRKNGLTVDGSAGKYTFAELCKFK